MKDCFMNIEINEVKFITINVLFVQHEKNKEVLSL